MKFRVHFVRASYTFRDVEAIDTAHARRVATKAVREQTKNWVVDKVEPISSLDYKLMKGLV